MANEREGRGFFSKHRQGKPPSKGEGWSFFSKRRKTVEPSKADPSANDADREGNDPPPARITLLYESRDGKLCLFEDGEGHLTVVRAEKLA